MSNKIKQFLALSACAFFLACGETANERGIASTTSDSTASGSAYNSNDGFAPAAPPKASQNPTTTVATPAASADSAVSTVVPAAGTSTTAAGTTVAAGTTAAVEKPAAAAKPAAPNNSADIKKGESLISKSDCLACHQVDGKRLGPSYRDVAAKYANNASTVNQLVDKIKKGGSGVWGDVPMSPHPALSDDDAKAMVSYILSLK